MVLPAATDATTDAAGDNESENDSLADNKNLLSNNKGKLAVGVAATLGLMIFYSWRENRLEKKDPEEYARLQRLKASIRAQGIDNKDRNTQSKDNLEKSNIQPDS